MASGSVDDDEKSYCFALVQPSDAQELVKIKAASGGSVR
jgi:hypothetical protein